ncbi:sulfurtransferase TusA family protein [Paraburkholderia sp. Ac-20347]|uniref:sulfurtransferase TusA family protein n=1 Tax=Paraburkholderia sp. Ac-20347 TaxID=2703892 RepID=UPI001F126ADB|nr:sulfurtransferase TusA family protein [Paraburkholderia sp. Ac-20347]
MPLTAMTETVHLPTGDSSAPFDVEWDAGDLGCGELLLKLRVRLRTMPGKIIRLIARDRGAIEDIPSYCRITGHQLLLAEPDKGIFFIKAKG